jgi:hypothetical protein
MNYFSNYTLKATLAIGLLVSIQSCNVTDVSPTTNLSQESAFLPTTIPITMAGLYDAAQTGYYDPLNGTALQVRGYPFGSANVQQADMRGADLMNLAAFYAFTYNGTYNTASANNVNMWLTIYSLINQCNFVIDGVQKARNSGTLSATLANGYEAEARFLRALSYHELLIHFARPYSDNNGNNSGVPIRDFPIISQADVAKASSVGRSTVAQVYTFILQDLDFAETNGFNRSFFTISPQFVSRATKGAAIALKTRIKLHQQDWAGVIAEAVKLATGTGPTFTAPSAVGGYALQSAPQGPFTNNTTTESIFSIEHNAQDNPSVNGGLANMYLPNSGTIAGRGLVSISPLIWNNPLWLATDLRRTTLTIQNAGDRPYVYKFRDFTNRTDFNPILRYAEVLMNYAEAEAQLNGNTTLALNLLNAIRNRAVTAPANQFTSFANTTALLDAIYMERRIEFLGEGRAWPDIHRRKLDVPAKVLEAAGTVASFNAASGTYPSTGVLSIPYSDYRYLWPIPAVEIANNPTLASQQNPGW